MNKIIALTKVFLKSAFKNYKTKNISDKQKSSKGMTILFLFSFIYIAGIVGFLSCQTIGTLQAIHQEEMFLGLILLAIMGFILIQSIFSSISLLYFSKDNEYILPLPVKPSQIIIAKTNIILFIEYFIEIIIGFIPLILYGILTMQGPIYYIFMIIVLLIIPIVPIIISSLFVMIIMSFSKFARNKNKFQVIATIFLIVFIMLMSFVSSSSNNPSQEEIIQMVTKANGMTTMIKGYFPTLSFAIDALNINQFGKALINLLSLIVSSLAIYCIYILIAKKIYLKGAVGSLVSGKRTKKIDLKKGDYTNSNVTKTYILKEFRILLRNPIYLVQCMLPAVLFPILMIGIAIMGIVQEGGNISEISTMIPQEQANSVFIVAGILSLLQFFVMFIYISATAISRDGQNATFMKYIPLALDKQITYKVMPNIIMNIITTIISMVIFEYILKLPMIHMILIFIVSCIIIVFESYLLILVDLKNPKLEWSSEYSVVKQNINLVWPMIFEIINISIIVLLAFVLNKFNVNIYAYIIIIAIIYLIATRLLLKYIKNNQENLFKKIY